MAGRMEFAASAAWGSAPRARFNGLYKIASKGFRGSPQAELDVRWLLRLMETASPTTSKPLVPRADPPLALYTDASGQPLNGFGAFLIDGDSILWTGCQCPEALISSLSDRTTQINPLEVCGVILGLWTFQDFLAGRRVIVYIDNQAAFGAIRKGRSSVPDFNELVFFARGICGSCNADPVFIWVPSDLNWADAPSRCSPPVVGSWIPPVAKWQALCSALPKEGCGGGTPPPPPPRPLREGPVVWGGGKPVQLPVPSEPRPGDLQRAPLRHASDI